MKPLAQRRWRVLAALVLGAGLLCAGAVFVQAPGFAPRVLPDLGPALPGAGRALSRASRIVIETPALTYGLDRTETGWGLDVRQGYPVDPSRMLALTEGLVALTRERAMTRDPGKFERLGVADPRLGGDGARLTLLDREGKELAGLIVGVREGVTYVRDPSADQSWQVRGGLPPLRSPALWLRLDVIDRQASDIASVTVSPEGEEAYDIQAAQGGFVLNTQEGPVRLSEAGATPALALLATDFIDVRPRAGVGELDLFGRHTTVFDDGLSVTLELRGGRGQVFALISASGPEAEALNAQTQDWAYAIAPFNAASFMLPRQALLR